MTDWSSWHAAYDDPASSLAGRLEVVKRRLVDALDALDAIDANGGARSSILSLCAGEGRDVVAVLSRRRPAVGRVVLVERDPVLARRAVEAARAAQLTSVEVRCADAGRLASFADLLPVDVLVLCGVFGNLAHEDVESVAGMIPLLVAPGGFVLWTRGGSEPDRRPEIRRWFAEAGMHEVAFDGAPAFYGVGLHRRPAEAVDVGELPDVLFTFDEPREMRHVPPWRGGRDPAAS